MSKFKRFFKQNKARSIILIVCLIFGGASNVVSLAGIISTLLYIVSIALAVQLSFEWREFEKPQE